MSKEKVLDEALKSIEKQFGKWSIMKLGSNKNLGVVNTYHSGSYLLDIILGGWYPEGRVVEIYGPESSGKTTIALHAIAEIQKRGETCAFIDAEHALDPQWAKKIWVDIDNLLLAQPDYGEQALSIAEELAKTGAVKLIVIDSVAAMVPRAEVEGDMWDSHMGLQARMMSQGLRKLTSILAKTGTTCIFINQIRMKIWVIYGNPETTTGGNALKFYASQRIEIRRGQKIEENKEAIGYTAKIKIVKNKVAAPFKKLELPVMFNRGYDLETDLIESAMMFNLVTRAGAFYTLWDTKVQWREKLRLYLIENDAIRENLAKQVQTHVSNIRMWKEIIPNEISVVDASIDEIAEEVKEEE